MTHNPVNGVYIIDQCVHVKPMEACSHHGIKKRKNVIAIFNLTILSLFLAKSEL